VLALEDTGSRMTRLGKAAITGSPLLSLDESIAAVEAVTTADVAAVADLMLGGPFTLAVVGPFEDAEAERLRAHVDREAA
jgi:predicted Zn-dependent peptidase